MTRGGGGGFVLRNIQHILWVRFLTALVVCHEARVDLGFHGFLHAEIVVWRCRMVDEEDIGWGIGYCRIRFFEKL